MLTRTQIQQRNRAIAGAKPRTRIGYIKTIQQLSQKWHIPVELSSEYTLSQLNKEYDQLVLKMNVINMTKKQGSETIASGFNGEMARKNGIIVKPMSVKNLFIEDYRYHLKRKSFNDIIKLEIQRRKIDEESNGQWEIESMTLEEFLEWLEGYEFDYEWEVLNMTRYTIPMSGGCYCKSGFVGSAIIGGFKFNWKTVKTVDGDCVFANFIKDSGFKGKQIKQIRQDININAGDVFIEDIQKICEYFDCQLKLWIDEGNGVRFEEFNIQATHTSIQLLSREHYWRLTEDPFPIEKTAKMNLKKITSNEITHFENFPEEIIKRESEFESFQEMSKQIHETDKNVLIMGAGGTGKSTLCRKIVEHDEEQYIITSTMSNSARLIGGQTIHMIMQLSKDKKFAKQYKNKILIIDEIGYLDGSAFDSVINMIISVGFKKVILFGDLLQLPPCDQGIYGYFFQSIEYESIARKLLRIELEIIKRTDNQDFIEQQQKIRIGDYSQMEKYFQDCIVSDDYQVNFENQMVLVPTNTLMDKYNKEAIQQLFPAKIQVAYEKVISFNEKMLMQIYENDLDKIARFKAEELDKFNQKSKKCQQFIQGAKIVFTENYDFNNGLTNGRIAKIVNLLDNSIEIEINDGNRFMVTRSERRGKIVFRSKFPFKIAYAMTIHKAQGLTIHQELVVDLKGLFEKQQLYVAISRVTDPKLLKIKNLRVINRGMQHEIMDFINNNEFECFQTRMLIDNCEKQMKIRKHKDTKLVNLNTIYMDFETAFQLNKYGSKKQVAYMNSIQHWYDYQIQETLIITDFQLSQNEIQEYNQQNCQCIYEENVELYSLKYILQIIDQYTLKIKGFKSINDHKSIQDNRKYIPTLVAHNGSGFDLFFLLKQMMKMEGFGSLYGVNNIFKGSHLVFFQLVDKSTNQIVFKSWDSCQYTTLSLEKSLEGFVPDQAKKLGFHEEIVFIAKNYYEQTENYGDGILKEGRISNVTYYKVLRTEQITPKDIDLMTKESLQLYLFDAKPNRSYRFQMQKQVNLRQELLKYALNDTTTLPVLCLKLESIAFEMVGCSCFNFLTFGSYTWYGLLQNLPKEAIDGKTYDSNRHSKLRTKNGGIMSKLYRNEQREEDFIRKAVYGGQSKPNALRLQFDKYGYYIYCDISGMYCDIMLKRDVPYGQKIWMDKSQLNDILKWLNKIESYKGTKLFELSGDLYEKRVLELIKDQPLDILDADFEENPYSLNPVVQYKHQDSGVFKTRYRNDRRRQNVSILSLIQIVLKGGQVYELFAGIRYECKGTILAPWVNKCLKQKNQGKVMNKQAIIYNQTNPDQPKNEKCGQAYITSGKTGANACYGQTIKQDRHETTIFADKDFDCNDFHANYTLRNIFLINDEFDLIVAKKKIDYKDFKTSRCAQIGCYVLEWSRFMLQCIYQTINPEQDIEKQPLTGDTDSLLIREDLVLSRLIPNGWMQDLSGKLTDELAGDNQWYFGDQTSEQLKDPKYYKFVKVFKGIFPQPKTLAIKYLKPTIKKCDTCDKLDVNCEQCFKYLTVGEKIRSKGISITSVVNGSNETLTYDLFEELYNAECAVEMNLPEKIKFQKPENIKKSQMSKEGFIETAYNCVQLNITRKMFNTKYQGRILVDNQWFIPYGHQSLKNLD